MTVALHHVVEGPPGAPVVVLGSSVGTALEMWDPQAAVLARRYRVVRYDHRGHGRSPVPPGPYAIDELGADVLALLDALDIERATLGGLSLGGMVAMWVAAHATERVERLLLCCTSAQLGPREVWDERIATTEREGTGALVDGALERWLTAGFRAERPDVAERLAAMLRATPDAGYAGCCAAIRDMDLRADLAAIHAPALVVAATDDPSTPPPHARVIADAIPGARLAQVPGAHIASVEHPETVTSLLRSFLAEDERGPAVRRAVLGDAHVNRAAAATTPLTAAFQDLITRYAWGEIWTRPGLDRRMRSAITLTALVARGHWEELALHVRAARRNGLSHEEIGEVLLQTAIYCGVPAANAAFAVAQRVLGEEIVPEGGGTP